MNADKRHNGSKLPFSFIQFIPTLAIEAPTYLTQEVGVGSPSEDSFEINLSILISEHCKVHFKKLQKQCLTFLL